MTEEEQKRAVVSGELDLLARAIEYSQDQATPSSIADSTNAAYEIARIRGSLSAAYYEFLRVAWGKAIRISTEGGEEHVFRVSQAAAIFPFGSIATPNSPIGRLVNISRPGDSRESVKLGHYEVNDVWYFERYVGPHAVKQQKNFKLMQSRGEKNFEIEDLQSWLSLGVLPIRDKPAAPTPEESPSQKAKRGERVDVEDTNPWGNFVDNDPDESLDNDLDAMGRPDRGTSTITLSTRFYVNLSEEQYAAVHAEKQGFVLVDGVAGSGKTSVALGRSKALAQRGQLSTSDPDFDPSFSDETQLGIVRTGELIAYLRDTCRELAIPNMPVIEYRDLQDELKAHWDLNLKPGRRGKHTLIDTVEPNVIGTYEWYEALGRGLLTKCAAILKNRDSLKGLSASVEVTSCLRKIDALVNDVFQRILKRGKPHRLLVELSTALQRNILDSVFSKGYWLGIQSGDTSSIQWYFSEFDDMSDGIENAGRVLCCRKSAYSIEIIIPENRLDDWGSALPTGAEYVEDGSIPSSVTVRNGEYEYSVGVRTASSDELRGMLTLGTLRFFVGLGRDGTRIRTEALLTVHQTEVSKRNEKGANDFRNIVQGHVRRIVAAKLKYLDPVRLYVSVGGDHEFWLQSTGDREFAEEKSKRINDFHMTTLDYDALCAFALDLTYGADDEKSAMNARHLSPPNYRSSVFSDEIQDFTELQVRVMSLMADPKFSCFTAVGDPAQKIGQYGAELENLQRVVPYENFSQIQLNENVRQGSRPALANLSSKFRGLYIDDRVIIAPQDHTEGDIGFYAADVALDELRYAYKQASSHNINLTIAVVCPNKELAEAANETLGKHFREQQHRNCEYSESIDLTRRNTVHITTPQHLKGLEFDVIIGLHLEQYDLSQPLDRNKVYVLLTRAKVALRLTGLEGGFSPDANGLLELLEAYREDHL